MEISSLYIFQVQVISNLGPCTVSHVCWVSCWQSGDLCQLDWLFLGYTLVIPWSSVVLSSAPGLRP